MNKLNLMNRRNFIKRLSSRFFSFFSGSVLLKSTTALSTGIGVSILESCADTTTDASDPTTVATVDFALLPILEHANNGLGGSYTLDTLTVAEQSHRFVTNGTNSETIALRTNSLNTQTYGGPVIKVTKGDTVEFNIFNNLTTPISTATGTTTTATTNHWHGLHIVGQIDGTPHQSIASNKTWNIKMKIQQEASTCWYHSHIHGCSQALVNKGHIGMFIIDDANSNALSIPKTTHIDDFPVIAKYQGFNNNGTINLTGTANAKMLANGLENSVLKVEKKWIRLRILNGSDGEAAKTLTFTLANSGTFYKIATDGGFLDNPVGITSMEMAPGERNEILIDFTNFNIGDQLVLQANPRTGGGARTAQTFFTFEVKANDSNEVGITNFNTSMDLRGNNGVAKIDWSTVKTNAATLFANPLVALSVRINPGAHANTVTYNTNSGSNTGTTDNVLTQAPTNYSSALVGVDTDNTAQVMNANVVNFSVKKNMWQVWSFRSANHPLHVHGCSFLLLSVNGTTDQDGVNPEDRGWKDVIYPTQGGGDSKFLVKFDYHTLSASKADATANPDTVQASTYSTAATTSTSYGTIGANHVIADYDPYMIHCHFLHHEDGGMMGQFNVVS